MGMEKRETEAIIKWLGIEGSEDANDARESIGANPLHFFETHLDVLPPHLLELFSKTVSPVARGSLARIRARRRCWVQVMQPDELGVQEARKRDPLLYKSFVSSMHRRTGGPNEPGTVGTGTSSTSTPPGSTVVEASSSNLVDEDVMLTLKRQQGRIVDEAQGEDEQEEEEEDSSDEEGGEDDDFREEEFKNEVIQRYIQGDVSPL
jgi:hypothetical protein